MVKKKALEAALEALELKHRSGSLPVNTAYDLILDCCARHATTVVVGETGSGKSTQIPQFLVEKRKFGGKVVVTQPRRVAAISLAKRVCEERKVKVGTFVGYTVRFDNATCKSTRLRYVTDGMLLREAMLDPLLNAYSVIMLDEAHERSLGTDILFGVVKKAQRERKGTRMPLRIIVMSATLDVKLFLNFFAPPKDDPNNTPFDIPAAIYIQGRQHKVDVLYTSNPQTDYLDSAVVSVLQVHMEEGPGDILVFLTGQEEIESCAEMLEEKSKLLPAESLKLIVCPIFAALPSHEQMKVFRPAPDGARKVVLATNIAETSITISGVRFVIDTGMVKTKSYSASTGLELLQVAPESQEQAWQRAGRAGREASGKCFRLFREDDFIKLSKRSIPEVKRVELSQVVLQLLSLGIKDIATFEFIQTPPKESIEQALFLLLALGAVRVPSSHEESQNGAADGSSGEMKRRLPQLTDLGKKMAALPLDPMHAKFLLDSVQFKCTEQALIIAAMLSVESPMYVPRAARSQANKAHARFLSYDADHLTLLNIYRGYVEVGKDKTWCSSNFIKVNTLSKADRVLGQLKEMIASVEPSLQSGIQSCGAETEPVLKCLVSAFSLRVAQKLPDDGQRGTKYKTMMEGMEVKIHPSSCLSQRDPMPEWLVFNEIVLTSKKYLKGVAAIEQRWLTEVAPSLFSTKEKKVADAIKRKRASTSSTTESTARKRKLLMCD